MSLRSLIALSALTFFAFSGVAKASNNIRIAYQPSPLYAPLFVAKTNNWIEEELKASKSGDVKVDWAVFAAGPAINESFAAGQQDIGFMGDSPALIGKSVGIDTKIVGLSVSGSKGQAVIVAAKALYSSPKDLIGKKVAVTKGSFAQHLLALVLEKEGLSFNDIELINMPPGDIPVAIISGTIDAGVTWEPYITRYESEDAIRVLVDGTGLKKGTQPILASRAAIEKKRIAVEAVLRAYVRGAEFLRAHPKEAAVLASKESNLSPEWLEKVFAKQNFAPVLTGGDIAEFKMTETYMRKIGLLKTGVDVDAWIDRSFFPAKGNK
ncbi:MAG: aliphatic sulfonate ABC transporter substrate-binding protein [Bdellovibrionales bacterium]